MSGKKPVKRRFKPKKPADIKDEPKDEIEEPAQVQQAAAAEITPKKKQKEKTPKPKKERKYTQIRGVLDASSVGHRAFHPHEEIPLRAQLLALFTEAAS